tara:strand:- start:122 stop:268 length:147 start_codon:yes stop_codon:yes gene_type:complete
MNSAGKVIIIGFDPNPINSDIADRKIKENADKKDVERTDLIKKMKDKR